MNLNNNLSKLSLFLLFVFAILGGIFFGLFSCGGYLWHERLFFIIMSLIVIIFLIAPSELFKKHWNKLLIVAISIFIFNIFRIIASVFYPTFPDSFKMFFELLIKTIQNGAC